MKNRISFNWHWIKEYSKVNPEARALVKLAEEANEEPEGFYDKGRLIEWLDVIDAAPGYLKIINELQTEYHNTKKQRLRDE